MGGQSGDVAVIERKIKDLAFALEALSRINSPQAAQASEAVESLLSRAISDAHKEYNPLHRINLDDDIPF